MLNTLFSFLILIFVFSSTTKPAPATTADNKSLQSPLQQFDFQLTTSRLDHIHVPSYVSTLYTDNYGKKQATATDHSIISAINTSVQLCKRIGGEKAAATCSYLLIDRPWRRWRQKLSQSFHDTKTRYVPVIYNAMVMTLNHPYVDGLYAIQNKIHDWWKLPSLEWYLLKSRLVALWEQYYHRYYYNKQPYSEAYPSLYDDAKDWWISYYSNYYDTDGKNDDGKLEPDQDGCYYDVLGTALCMDEQRLLDDNGLKDRVNKIFEAMTFEERSYTLRFQQRFIQWATKASLMTAEALDRAQSLWLQNTQATYQFLDDALSLDPHTNSNSSKQDEYDQELASKTRTANQMNLCPPVVFPFSTSPFDTSHTTFFSLGSGIQSLRSTPLPPTTHSYLSLTPIRRRWTECLPIQNDNIGDSNNKYGKFDIPGTTNAHVSQQLLDPYNKIQHQYLLTRLQKEMMKQLERLEKATLQEYYRIMDTTPHQSTVRHYDHTQQQQLQKLHVYIVGCAAQQLYQELRLYISISLQQHYRRSIQQLMDVTKQYNDLVMKQVERAYDEWEWIRKQQARRLFTFYPLHDDPPNTNHHEEESENNSPASSSSSLYPEVSIVNTRAVIFIGQRADWAVQAHRKTVLHQWKTIFAEMDRQSRSIWVSAMDQAQGRHRIWASCNSSFFIIIAFIVMAKLVILVLFLLYF